MSENHQSGPQAGVASMVGGILEDAQKLARQEIALALSPALASVLRITVDIELKAIKEERDG